MVVKLVLSLNNKKQQNLNKFEVEFLSEAFWDKDKKALVICTNGFIKKTKKLPVKELSKAKRIRSEYFKKK